MKNFNREEKVVTFINPESKTMLEVRVTVSRRGKKYFRIITIIKIGKDGQTIEYGYHEPKLVFKSFESFKCSLECFNEPNKKNLELLEDVKKFFNKKIA